MITDSGIHFFTFLKGGASMKRCAVDQDGLISESAKTMLYTDDEITEYEYEIVGDVKWKDDNTEAQQVKPILLK